MMHIKKTLLTITALLLIFTIASGIYIMDYYPAESSVLDSLISDSHGTISTYENITVFSPAQPKAGFVFYPGGKVEYTAYAPLMKALCDEDILCILFEMPGNLAVMDLDAAEGIQEQFPDVSQWYIGGHSLGGSMASVYLSDSSESYAGLVLLASYSTVDLSDSELKVISLYGSEDGILNYEKYSKYKSNLPDDFQEHIISGGNHAQFGKYGIQNGDGDANISTDDQIKICAEFLLNFFLE